MFLRRGTCPVVRTRLRVRTPEGITRKAVSERDRARNRPDVPLHTASFRLQTGWPNVGYCQALDPPHITDCLVMSFQHANGVPN